MHNVTPNSDKCSRARNVTLTHTSEQKIEKYLVEQVKKAGGKALKFASNIDIGYPDRLVLLRRGQTVWVEVKKKGGKPRRLQLVRMEELKSLGQQVCWVDSFKGVDDIIAKYTKNERD